MVTFFRRLNRAERIIRADTDNPLYEERIDLLDRVNKYILSCNFIKKPQHKFVIQNSDAEVSYLIKETGMSKSGIMSFRQRASKQLTDQFGVEFCDYLIGDKSQLELAQTIFFIIENNLKAEDIVNSSLVSNIRKRDDGYKNVFDVKDCVNEIKLLIKYSNQQMLADIMECDIDKLVFLVQAIEGTEGISLSDRANLINKIAPSSLED